MTAACAGHPEPLWDAHVPGEHELERVARHARALAICRTCPARVWCASVTDVRHDDGVRAGMLLPTIHDSNRLAVSSFTPGRGGLARLVGLGDKFTRHAA